jgi:hypothetical protein
MPTIKGRYSEGRIVLNEPAPVEREVEVTISFPDTADTCPEIPEAGGGQGHAAPPPWGRSPAPGLPPLPTEEEWRRRIESLGDLIREWAEEEPGDDLATYEELDLALRERPVQFREIRIDE